MMSITNDSCGPTTTLEALLQQEERSYLTKSCHGDDDDNNHNNTDMMISDGDRQKLADWMERVRCHFYWSPSTVEVGLNLLDRYLLLTTTTSTTTTQQPQPNYYYDGSGSGNDDDNDNDNDNSDDNEVLLACLTCFYIAGKTCEFSIASPHWFVKASRGLFSIEDIEIMEQHILQTLEWRVHPPTSFVFVQEIVQILQTTTTTTTTTTKVPPLVLDLEMVKVSAIIMCELCVGHDPVLRGIPKSLIAIAAVSKALSIHQKQQQQQSNYYHCYKNKNLMVDYSYDLVNHIPALQKHFSSCRSSSATTSLKTIEAWLHCALVQEGYQIDDDEQQQQKQGDDKAVSNPLHEDEDDDDVSCNGSEQKKKVLLVQPPPSPRTVTTAPAALDEEIHEDDPSLQGIKRKISFDDEERDEQEEEEDEHDDDDSRRLLPFERRVRTKFSSSKDKEGFACAL